ncbi:aminodeoxychorismate lyase [Paenibacillus swuensis]|uniref:Endolytic murein transglycosylase n=1 Tax=Paenibacillus swuensis TaxID=1178515 RepID=A0A172TQ42_9BACL|nr:aminodeoxychorismate lyase [Paenibacillus swuensis]
MRAYKKWLIGLLIGVIVLAAAVYGYVSNGLSPAAKSNEEVKITIEQGMGSRAISDTLEKQGLIRNADLFLVYLKYRNEGSKFKAGTYAFKPGVSLDQIIDRINRGDTVKEETTRFTIPEGYTLRQIADKLALEGIADRKVFLEAAKNPDAIAPELAQTIPKGAVLKFPMEGYLFPETYEFKKGSTEQDILVRMTQELKSKLEQLPADWETTMKDKRKLTFHEMLTVASLVEREVIADQERPLVAGVIYNRLADEMRLQIDATVQYLFDKPKARLLYKDLELESVYNTYLHSGLPPGPIANPSLASIKAAIYPEPSKFLFYVTKKDGTRTHLFAETFKQHQKNIEISNQLAND